MKKYDDETIERFVDNAEEEFKELGDRATEAIRNGEINEALFLIDFMKERSKLFVPVAKYYDMPWYAVALVWILVKTLRFACNILKLLIRIEEKVKRE